MDRPPEISFSKPIDQAFGWTREMLFDPFDLKRWFVLGFAAFLMLLGRGGGFSGNFPTEWRGADPFDPSPGGDPGAEVSWILFVIFLVLAVVLVFIVVFVWLSSRATFVFLDGVVRNEARIVEPWGEWRVQANSLFKVNLALIGLLILLIALVAGVVYTVLQATETSFAAMSIGAILVLAAAAVGLWIALALFQLILYDFVVPVMYLRRTTFLPAWREIGAVLRGMALTVLLYALVRFLIGILVAIATMLSILATCCVAMIPYIGEVIRLPLHVWTRAYSLYFLSQLSPDYAPFARLGNPPDLASVFE